MFLRILLLVLCFAPVAGACAAADWSSVPSRDNRGTVLIRTNWVDKDGPQSGTGTGFVVSKQGHILTVAHQFPHAGVSVILYTGDTEGWPSVYTRQSFPLNLTYIDRQADFAVLVPTKEVPLSPVPTLWTWAPLEGAEVNTRGFPLGGPLEGMPGTIRRSGASPEVPMTMMLRAGYSGSPVYDATGRVVCMVRGGTPVADVKDPTVMGLGFCLPLALLKSKVPSELLADSSGAAPAAALKGSGEIRISYSVNETKETAFNGLQDLTKSSTTRPYTTGRLEAQNGYRIAKYEYLEHSATRVSNRVVQVAPDGDFLEMTYDLTSGPGYDRWRDWLAATIVTVQVPKDKK